MDFYLENPYLCVLFLKFPVKLIFDCVARQLM